MTATSQGHQERLSQLLASAKNHTKAGRQKDGEVALREAIALSSGSVDSESYERVREAIQSLQLDDTIKHTGDLTTAVSSFASNIGEDKAASELIKAASEGNYTVEEAEKALELLFLIDNDDVTKNTAITSIVTNQNGRKATATLLQKNATETFDRLWDCGETVVSAVVTMTSDTLVWPSEQNRLAVQRDVFLLLLAKLLEPAQEASAMGMRALSRLLATDAANIVPFIDASNFDIVLSMLDVQQSAAIRSQATLVTAKLLELEPERGQKLLTGYVVSRAGKANVDDLVAAFSVATAIFPILPAIAANMFMTPGFLEDLVAINKKSNSARLGRASLELLSAACVDKNCREAISDKCAVWLQDVMQEKSSHENEQRQNLDAALASLILCKIQIVPKKDGTTIDIGAIASFLKTLIQEDDEVTVQTAVEGLAYATVQGRVKEDLATDTTVLKSLIARLKDPSQKGLLFGGLTIISNLTRFTPAGTAEQERIAQLKAYANQSRPDAADTLNNDEHVAARCRKVIDAGTVPILAQAVKTASPTLTRIIAEISLALTKNPKQCGLLVQQGKYSTNNSI